MCESMSHHNRVRHEARTAGNHDLLKIRSAKTSSPSEVSENSLCKCRVAPGMAMTVGMTMVLPPSHSLKQWGRLGENLGGVKRP